jgi:hypothetical protein
VIYSAKQFIDGKVKHPGPVKVKVAK